MISSEKTNSGCVPACTLTPAPSSPELDLKRLVMQPKHPSSTLGTLDARVLVGTLLEIQNTDGTGLWMDVGGEQVPAQAAASCLLRVEAGDWVHAVLAGGVIWVLSILKKNSANSPAVRHLDVGEAELLVSAKTIRLHADQEIGLHAPLLTQAATNRQSHIAATDSARVGNSIVHAKSHLSLHARSAMVTAASLLKVDAAQIHMG
jgi:hypothetical protein